MLNRLPLSLAVLLLLVCSCGMHEENPFGADLALGNTLYIDILTDRMPTWTWPQRLSDRRLRDKQFVDAVCSGHVECFVGPDNEPLSLILIVHHANETPVNLLRDSDGWKKVTEDEIKTLVKAPNRRRLELCPKK